jgi:hypothetical protein
MLLQVHQLSSHNAAEQSKFQRDFYSKIYCLSFIYLSTKKDCHDSYCVRLYSLMFGDGFGIWSNCLVGLIVW